MKEYKYKDIRTGRYVTPTGNNVKESINYLKNMGLDSKEIDKITDSFAPQTLQLEIAGSKEYGIRFMIWNIKLIQDFQNQVDNFYLKLLVHIQIEKV